MSKGSVWKNKDGKTVRRNQISGQFTWYPIEMLQSPAYRALSLSARRVIDRIRIEHAKHAGKDNGKLIITFQDFHDYGIHRDAIAPAIREAAALGFIRVTQVGRAGNGEFRVPNKFALTHLETGTGKGEETAAPTNDWHRIKTLLDAMAIADTARKAPARSKKAPRKKQNATPGNRTSTTPGNRTSNTDSPHPETGPLSVPETGLLSISREGIPPASSQPASNGHAPAAAAPELPLTGDPEDVLIAAYRANAPDPVWKEIALSVSQSVQDAATKLWPLDDQLAMNVKLLPHRLRRDGATEAQIEQVLRILTGTKRGVFH